MCIAIPGQIKSIGGDDPLSRSADVDFEGIHRSVNLALLPDAQCGEWVLVHAGVAIGKIDEDEAKKTINLLRQLADEGEEGNNRI